MKMKYLSGPLMLAIVALTFAVPAFAGVSAPTVLIGAGVVAGASLLFDRVASIPRLNLQRGEVGEPVLQKVIEDGLRTVEQKLEAHMAKYEGQLKDAGSVAAEVRAAVAKIAEEHKAAIDRLRALEQKQATAPGGVVAVKSWGGQFVDTPEFKAAVSRGGRDIAMRVSVAPEIKNTVISDSTTVLPTQRTGVIPGAFVPLTIRGVLVSIPVSTNAVNSLKENSFTNSAAEVNEGAAKNESDVTFTPYDVNIRTVAHWIKVSNALLSDAPAIAAYIDTRLRYGLAKRVDAQLLNGNGTSPNLSGLTDSGNYTAYTPTSDDNLADAINRAKYTMWAAGYIPDTVIVNPADWGAYERLREGTNSGTYLHGAPGEVANMNPFGLRIVLSAHLTAGKFVVMDSTAALIYDRQNVTVEMGYVNDDFTKNLVTIRAEERLALACERPAGIYYGDFTA